MGPIRTCLLLALAASLLHSATVSATDEGSATTESLPEKILFIGNSHTARHGGLDWWIGNMVAAEAAPRDFDGTIRTSDSMTLEYHYKNGAPEAIEGGGYDAVVLQSYLPGIEGNTITPFLEYGRLLDKHVRDSGARTVFFMTWPQGRANWAELEDFMTSHRQIADELGAAVAPAGLAFAMAEAARPDLQLLSDDGVHATWEGAYLAAATVYATLYQRSPEGLSFSFGVSPDDAMFLQGIAWQALTEWQAGG